MAPDRITSSWVVASRVSKCADGAIVRSELWRADAWAGFERGAAPRKASDSRGECGRRSVKKVFEYSRY